MKDKKILCAALKNGDWANVIQSIEDPTDWENIEETIRDQIDGTPRIVTVRFYLRSKKWLEALPEAD